MSKKCPQVSFLGRLFFLLREKLEMISGIPPFCTEKYPSRPKVSEDYLPFQVMFADTTLASMQKRTPNPMHGGLEDAQHIVH